MFNATTKLYLSSISKRPKIPGSHYLFFNEGIYSSLTKFIDQTVQASKRFDGRFTIRNFCSETSYGCTEGDHD